MQSMICGDKYRILKDGERLPIEIDKKDMDETIASLKEALLNVCQVLENFKYENYDLESIISSVASSACLQYDNGKIWNLSYFADELGKMEEQLKTDNTFIPSYSQLETAEDAGFRKYWHSSNIFEKKLEDNDEREVVEELVIYPDDRESLHRKRTIIWENVPGGRQSKEILYENLGIDEETFRIIKNTKMAILAGEITEG